MLRILILPIHSCQELKLPYLKDFSDVRFTNMTGWNFPRATHKASRSAGSLSFF
jgi:hypothetical protein